MSPTPLTTLGLALGLLLAGGLIAGPPGQLPTWSLLAALIGAPLSAFLLSRPERQAGLWGPGAHRRGWALGQFMGPLLGGLLLYLPVRLLYLSAHQPPAENTLLTEALKVVAGCLVMALALAAPRR